MIKNMKRASVIANIILLVIVFFLMIQNKEKNIQKPMQEYTQEYISSCAIEQKDDVYAAIDYPLLELSIKYNESNVMLIIVNNVMHPKESEYLCTYDKKILYDMQTKFNVISFPIDRGTTPDSVVYIYQDEILIKMIPFIGIYSNEQGFNLHYFNKNEVEVMLKQELPPAF